MSIPRIALTRPEATAAIGVGSNFFEESVAPELRLIRRGRKHLVPVTELERCITENAERWGSVCDGAAVPSSLGEPSGVEGTEGVGSISSVPVVSINR